MDNPFRTRRAKIAGVALSVFGLVALLYGVRSSIVPQISNADEEEFLLIDASDRELDGVRRTGVSVSRVTRHIISPSRNVPASHFDRRNSIPPGPAGSVSELRHPHAIKKTDSAGNLKLPLKI